MYYYAVRCTTGRGASDGARKDSHPVERGDLAGGTPTRKRLSARGTAVSGHLFLYPSPLPSPPILVSLRNQLSLHSLEITVNTSACRIIARAREFPKKRKSSPLLRGRADISGLAARARASWI